MRALILAFAGIAPLLLVFLWPHSWLTAISVLALSHALVLWPTLRPNSQWLGPVITCFDSTSNELWLTIDDGPTDDTEALLDALDERGVKATFFVKGSLAAQRPDLVRLMLARGHALGNHSRTHPSGTFWCLPPSAITSQIDACSAALEAMTGKHPALFRAPVGMKNPFVHPILARRGLTLVGWSIRGFDSFGHDAERVVRRIVSRIRAGSIVVMHQGRGFSVACISRVIDEARGLGYSFVIPSAERLKTKR
jgi:peptidoglycan/xylan/chitin deacetylase (PgdA/CDA1 family)